MAPIKLQPLAAQFQLQFCGKVGSTRSMGVEGVSKVNRKLHLISRKGVPPNLPACLPACKFSGFGTQTLPTNQSI